MPEALKRDGSWPSAAGSPAGRELVRNVLVVDDSKLQRKIVSASLRKWGYQVVEAASGLEALEICRCADPDLILSDWMMPGMTGIEFCDAYRALGHDNYGYFILLTSRADKQDVALGLERGADDFLTKPVNGAELRARLAAGERILSMHRVVTERNRQLNDTLGQLREVNRALDRDLKEARRLQQSLVPQRFHGLPGADVSLLLRPSGHVGGDLVGMFPAGDGHVGIYGIDVAGHGIASALMTARLAGYLSGASPERNIALTTGGDGRVSMRPPHEVCSLLNRLIGEDLETGHYFTMALADCDLSSGAVRMVQAGHPSPLIQRRDGSMEFVGAGGMPIGLIEGAEYTSFDLSLAPGDRLLIHSDGITECPGLSGSAMLDDDGLCRIAAQHAGRSGPAFLESLVTDLIEFSGGDDFPDDVSATLYERKSDPSPQA